MTTLDKELRMARERRGFTQAQIAQALKVKRPIVTMYENGKCTPPLAVLVKLENVLGVTDGKLILASTHADLAMEIARALQKRVSNAN